LGNIEAAKSDQTVVAIILLGLYEVRTHEFALTRTVVANV